MLTDVDGELEESPDTTTVDQEGDSATQEDNKGEQSSLEDAEVHEEPEDNKKKDAIEEREGVKDVEIQQASPPDGIIGGPEDTVGSLGKDVDLETGNMTMRLLVEFVIQFQVICELLLQTRLLPLQEKMEVKEPKQATRRILLLQLEILRRSVMKIRNKRSREVEVIMKRWMQGRRKLMIMKMEVPPSPTKKRV